jgi:hypothetical protein
LRIVIVHFIPVFISRLVMVQLSRRINSYAS